jgi:hypothetical protein
MTQTAFDNRVLFRQIRPGDTYIRLTWKFISGKHTWQEYFVDEYLHTAEQQAHSFKAAMEPLAVLRLESLIVPSEAKA